MKKVETEIYKRFPRRKLDKHSITLPEASLSVRTLIDRTAEGKPVNARLSKHIPLPDDGIVLDDFETGTEEITDIVDAVEFSDKIRNELSYIEKQKEEARQQEIGVEVPKTAPNSNSEAPL